MIKAGVRQFCPQHYLVVGGSCWGLVLLVLDSSVDKESTCVLSPHCGGGGSQMRVETQGFFESGKTTGPGDRRVNLRVHSFLGKFSAPSGGADSSPATIKPKSSLPF